MLLCDAAGITKCINYYKTRHNNRSMHVWTENVSRHWSLNSPQIYELIFVIFALGCYEKLSHSVFSKFNNNTEVPVSPLLCKLQQVLNSQSVCLNFFHIDRFVLFGKKMLCHLDDSVNVKMSEKSRPKTTKYIYREPYITPLTF